MDRDSGSPETKLSERACSFEPSSTRPNPFKVDVETSRKRRRTSFQVDSVPRSADPDRTPPSKAFDAVSDIISSSAAVSPETVEDDVAMSVDKSALPLPHTPENTLGNSRGTGDVENMGNAGQHSTDTPPRPTATSTTPSHVTLSFRNSARRALDTIASSRESSSSPPSSPSPAQPHGRNARTTDLEPTPDSSSNSGSVDNNIVIPASNVADLPSAGVAEPEMDSETPFVSATAADEADSAAVDLSADSPLFSQSGNASPPVELIDILEEDVDNSLEEAEAASITLLDEENTDISNIAFVDPTTSFPYWELREPPLDAMYRLKNFLTTDPTLAREIRNWIDKYLLFARCSPFDTVYRSYVQYRQLWFALPLLVSETYELHDTDLGATTPEMHENLVAFCVAFARLSAYFLEFDLKLLQRFNSSQGQEFVSSPYLAALMGITKREPLRDSDQSNASYRPDFISEILHGFISYYRTSHCGSMVLLDRLFKACILLVPTPQSIENMSNTCALASFISREAFRRIFGYSAQNIGIQTNCIALGQSVFSTASVALENIIHNHITYLSKGAAKQMNEACTELLYINLKVNQNEAMDMAASIAESDPIPLAYIPDAFAMKWQFELFCSLIKSNQMELRLMATETLAQELINCWRRYGDQVQESQRQSSVTAFVADILEKSGVVSYLLGPTCHPTITAASYNIVGFLAVSQTYTNAHTDLVWQTVTTAQDPRISDAVHNAIAHIAQFFSYDIAFYFAQRFQDVHVSALTAPMRRLCETLFCRVVSTLTQAPDEIDAFVPFDICMRLLRESSVQTAEGFPEYPESYRLVAVMLAELLNILKRKFGYLDDDQRRKLYRPCISDIKLKSETTLGSIYAINIGDDCYGCDDLAYLASDCDLTRLFIDELEVAFQRSVKSAVPYAILNGPDNIPRWKMLFNILKVHSSTLTPELSARLWDMMAGTASPCNVDRNSSWELINKCMQETRGALRRSGEAPEKVFEDNQFLSLCLTEFIPRLPPACFCQGLLIFLREHLMKAEFYSITPDSLDVDSDKGHKINRTALEELWRIVLTTPPNTIEAEATHLLVKGVYASSNAILSLPLNEARAVCLALVNRCLQQMSTAAEAMRMLNEQRESASIADATTSADSKNDTESVIREQELKFLRSVQVLRQFLRQYRVNSLSTSSERSKFKPHGRPAELKYQSFDGDKHTEVRTLHIGRLDTAASLLQSLREATGFDKYKIYYRGQAFEPQQSDICQSLEDLHMHDCLILVKRDVPPGTRPLGPVTSASHIESSILDQFQELWGYLGMRETLASEVYELLMQLRLSDKMIRLFESDSLSYKSIIHTSQPYKSLYGLHALREFLAMRRRRSEENTPPDLKTDDTAVLSGSGDDTMDTKMPTDEGPLGARKPASPPNSSSSKDADKPHPGDSVMTQPTLMSPPESLVSSAAATASYASVLAASTNLVTAAICDPQTTEATANTNLGIDLFVKLLEPLEFVLEGCLEDRSLAKNFDANLLEHLLDMLSKSLGHMPIDSASRFVELAFRIIMEACSLNSDFWLAFKEHEKTQPIVEQLLLYDNRLGVRKFAEAQINSKVIFGQGSSEVGVPEMQAFFWPILLGLVPKAMGEPTKCEGTFNLANNCFIRIVDSMPQALEISSILYQTGKQLLAYTTLEDATRPEYVDLAMYGLSQLFSSIYGASRNLNQTSVLPPNFSSLLFWKHLFPPWQKFIHQAATSTRSPDPHVVYFSKTRAILMNTILSLVYDDPMQLPTLVKNLDQLVRCDPAEDESESYHYEMPIGYYDRSRVFRSSCGYVGLKNLSNTCYFNSLLTQLFMNVEFRRFMINIDTTENKESLIFQTRLLFSYLQDSIRQFIDTRSCISTVKSYEDGPIDIYIQMDVDEFFNLLFDRWEGQLSSAKDRKDLRDFYGGQIVQQMRSKECSHVSERLEPFSAIQCDIQGKTSLCDSLDAYVEGEIMSGDNQYKCSDCDRKVDAIKRVCFKDIPDNLIFHLKRFEFNLRNGTRNKINDKFSFPREIDMRPYTIDQLRNPSEKQAADMFELVGILVHSGTAESGHYYSYIRERPSSNAGCDNWVEFNDDMVSSWNPALMESMCFGGSEVRPVMNYNGVDGDERFEKPYSAYMLFYQRRLSLQREQDALVQSGRTSPAKVAIPTPLANHIQNENSSLVRQNVLFDTQHIPFVAQVLDQLDFARSGLCSRDHKLENRALQMALSHMDQVASRTKDVPDFQTLLSRVTAMGGKCKLCSLAIFDYFAARPGVFYQMVQKCQSPLVRLNVGNLVIRSLRSLKVAYPESYSSLQARDAEAYDESDPDVIEVRDNGEIMKDPYDRNPMELVRSHSILSSVQALMYKLWEHFHCILRSWPETFSFMEHFIKLGQEELGTFLDADGFRRALLVVSAEPGVASKDAQLQRMLLAIERRSQIRPVPYENIISLICTALAGMYPGRETVRPAENVLFVDDQACRFLMARDHPDDDLPMTQAESSAMLRAWQDGSGHINVFTDRLIRINQNTTDVDAILVRLMATHPAMEVNIFSTLKTRITSKITDFSLGPYLRVAVVFLRHAKSAELASAVMNHICMQCRGLINPEGRAFFEALCELFYGVPKAPASVDLKALFQGLQFLPVWVPGMLCYYDQVLVGDVEEFLREQLFEFGTEPEFEESAGGVERAQALKMTARRLGIECLRYMHLTYIERDHPIINSVVYSFRRVTAACAQYYATETEGDEDPLAAEFHQLSSTIPALIGRLTVDDIEEDGSGFDDPDWNSSHGSSEPADDSLGDASMQAVGDINDIDMP